MTSNSSAVLADSRSRADVVLVTPIVPQAGGNGLAMRAGVLLEALAERFVVDLVVVPVAGGSGDSLWAATHARLTVEIAPLGDERARGDAVRQLADPLLRRRLASAAPLPWRARAASPTLAPLALARLGPRVERGPVVFVLRGYLAPFGFTLARALGARRVVIDLDDDEEQLARALAPDEADAVGRLLRTWLADADTVCAAGRAEADAIASRHGLAAVTVLPNAVRIPALAPPPPPGRRRLLFVGNLTYEPNREAARLLANEILPLVRERLPGTTAAIVGPGDPGVGPAAGVELPGFVSDLAPWYRDADVVVVPLRHGAGTRIKVLEAFAMRRPVVASAAAVAGLEVRDDVEVMLGESPSELALAIAALIDDPARAGRLAADAARTLAARYSVEVVAPLVRALIDGGGNPSAAVTPSVR
jgi:glycosyltransferase involved in cell wall biosynthesis